MDAVDRFMWYMENVPGVQSTTSLVTVSKLVTKAMNEGNLNWSALSRNQTILNTSIQRAPSSLLNPNCSMAPVIVYLNDHKAETLETAVAAVEEFKAQYDDTVDEKYFGYTIAEIEQAIAAKEIDSVPVRFQLASGNAGIEAATNQVIADAQDTMLIFVYVVVFVLCFMTFRSFTAVACILIPLALTSVLSQALMTYLGIGVKVATLPVIALGVGIGVDYGIYIYSRLEVMIIAGKTLQESFLETLKSTGKAVSFTGITLAIGVATWMLSPIKFQADMGILLTFMFLWNMLGALILLPALAHYLLRPERIIARHKARHGDIPPAG
jgi:predicted RND superfamily exporter protein